MRRVTLLLSLCALLFGGLMAGVQAQQINIANDVNGGNVVDISLRDADLATVLAALFNTTGGKFQVRLGNGVNGRIGRLVLTQMPFDKALDAILGTDYSYTKQVQSDGIALYTITGRQGGGGTLYTPKPPNPFQAPAIGIPTFANDATAAPFGGGGAATPTSPLLNLGSRTATTGGTSTTTTSGDDAAAESSVVKLLRVNNLDVMALAEALGGTGLDLFALMNSTNGSSGTGLHGSSSGGSSGSSNNNSYNNYGNTNGNNSYNNNSNSNGNYNNSNNNNNRNNNNSNNNNNRNNNNYNNTNNNVINH